MNFVYLLKTLPCAYIASNCFKDTVSIWCGWNVMTKIYPVSLSIFNSIRNHGCHFLILKLSIMVNKKIFNIIGWDFYIGTYHVLFSITITNLSNCFYLSSNNSIFSWDQKVQKETLFGVKRVSDLTSYSMLL